MVKFFKTVNVAADVSSGLVLSGNIKDVSITLKNLAYVFRDCGLRDVNLQEFAEAERAINKVKVCRAKAQLRRRL